MRVRIHEIILLVSSVLLASCNSDTLNPISSISVGDYSSMKVVHYDTLVIGGYWDKHVLNIDLDEDGIFDVGIWSQIWGSPGLGHHPETDIASLNSETFINVLSTFDTTFVRYDTSSYYDKEIGKEIITYYEAHTCDWRYDVDTILNIRQMRHVTVLYKDDQISINDDWASDTLDLNHIGPDIRPQEIYESADTLIRKYRNIYNECKSFPNDEIAYIGVKKRSADQEFLGWVKLSIVENYKVFIFEFAIQN